MPASFLRSESVLQTAMGSFSTATEKHPNRRRHDGGVLELSHTSWDVSYQACSFINSFKDFSLDNNFVLGSSDEHYSISLSHAFADIFLFISFHVPAFPTVLYNLLRTLSTKIATTDSNLEQPHVYVHSPLISDCTHLDSIMYTPYRSTLTTSRTFQS